MPGLLPGQTSTEQETSLQSTALVPYPIITPQTTNNVQELLRLPFPPHAEKPLLALRILCDGPALRGAPRHPLLPAEVDLQ